MTEEWRFSGYIPDNEDRDMAELIMKEFTDNSNLSLLERSREHMFRAGFWRGMAWQHRKDQMNLLEGE